MEPQLFDQLLEESWSAAPCKSKSINTTSDLWPNQIWLNEYPPLAYNFEDLQNLDDLESGLNLLNSSSPPAFELPSPISDSSSLSSEDLFDQKPLSNPWFIPTDFENTTITPTTLCNSPSGENFPAIVIPSLTSSPSSPESNSSRDTESDSGFKRPIKQARKQRFENSRAKSTGCKRQNAHNLIEKRYRNNLNSKIQTLRDIIPRLRSATKENDEGEDGMDSDSGESRKAQKCNKGIILDSAIEYIAELEKQVKIISKQNARLRLKIEGSAYV